MMNHLKYYQTRAFLSRSFTFSSTKHPKPLSKILPFHHFHTNSISPTKTHLYASFFCTLIHLYLTCGRLSKATDTFYDMIRTHHIVPTLPLWNRLIYQFNATGLVSQNCYANLLVHGTWRQCWQMKRERGINTTSLHLRKQTKKSAHPSEMGTYSFYAWVMNELHHHAMNGRWVLC